VLRKLGSVDVIKKAAKRASKQVLISLPGFFNPAVGTTVGQIKHLDTRNPILYIETPSGRIRLRGSLIVPKSSKYVAMQVLRGAAPF
jgi:hypothetical protein